jgi:hypothetical protein
LRTWRYPLRREAMEPVVVGPVLGGVIVAASL